MATQRYSVAPHAIETLLAWVKTGEIAIPEIQRPFVWDDRPGGYTNRTAAAGNHGSRLGSKKNLAAAVHQLQEGTPETTGEGSPPAPPAQPQSSGENQSGSPHRQPQTPSEDQLTLL